MININLANIVGTSTSMKSDCSSSENLLKGLDFLSEFKLELENNGEISKNTEDVDNDLILYNIICELYQNLNKQENISSLISKIDINSTDSNNSVLQLNQNLLVSDDVKQALENINSYIEKSNEHINSYIEKNNSEIDSNLIIDKIKKHIEEAKNLNSNKSTYENLETIAASKMSKIDKKSGKTSEDIDCLENIISSKDNDYTSSLGLVNNFTNVYNNANVSTQHYSIEQPVTEIRQEFISDDIVKSVKYMKSSNLEELNVKFNPRDLGEININILKSDEQSNLFITVDNENVFDLVNKNLEDIKNHLKDTNINVKDVVITVKPGNESVFSDNLNQGFNQQSNFKQSQNSKYKKNNQEIIEDIVINDYENEDDNLNILI